MTAHCLLISANRMVAPYPVYPIGIAHLTGALVAAGHTVRHIDILADDGFEPLRQLLIKEDFDVIGISIRNVDTVDSSEPDSLLADVVTAIQYVRELTKAPVVLGGSGFSVMPEALLDFLQADYGIVGEGEIAFPRLIDSLLRGKKDPGRLFSAEITDYPRYQPVFTEKVAAYYTTHGGMLNVQTKRGCLHKCTYCSYPGIEGHRMRYRKPAEVVEEVERLVKVHHARYIFFTDGVFNDQEGHFREVAQELIRKGNTTPWCAFFRPQNLTREDLRLLKRSGLKAMELGTDCSTDTTLAGMNKGFSFADVMQLNQDAQAESIPCAHFIMFGGPGETEQTVQEGLKNILRLEGSVVFAYIGIRILPGTGLHTRAMDEGLITAGQPLIDPVYYYSPSISRSFIEEKLTASFKKRIDRIYACKDIHRRVQALHLFGKIGPLWDLLIPRKELEGTTFGK
jgi:lipid biosynthesis B12-binding/radical SAM protein